jgi:hypothetical protein
MRARRLIPKFLLVILTAGVGLGAWIGVRDEPGAGVNAAATVAAVPSSFVQRAVRATVHSGSATFEVAATAKGSGPALDSTDFGVGAVNFVRHSSEVSVYTNQTDQEFVGSTRQNAYHSLLHERETPKGSFLQLPLSVALPWTEVPVAPLPGPLGAMSEAYVGAAFLNLLHVPSDRAPRVVGHQEVDGVTTSLYAWSRHAAECYGSKGRYSQVSTAVVRMWLDRQGRIRKVETAVQQVSSSPNAPAQRLSTTDTLIFTSFGVPVSIATPRVPPGGLLTHAHIGIAKAVPSTRCPSKWG